jgi:DNA-directed RNA polymerase subunit E'/Rpb7
VFLIERWHRKGPGSHRQQSIMFVLTVLQDTLRIPPHNLSLPLQDALTRQICSLYFDKVLKDLGLCVTLYDIKAVEGGFVFPGDGAPRFTVDFRLVMFRPFVGEVLIAKLKTCDKSGLYCMFPFPISVMVNAAFPMIIRVVPFLFKGFCMDVASVFYSFRTSQHSQN